MATFGRLLEAARVRYGLSKGALARLAGQDRGNLVHLVNGEQNTPTLRIVYRYARAFDRASRDEQQALLDAGLFDRVGAELDRYVIYTHLLRIKESRLPEMWDVVRAFRAEEPDAPTPSAEVIREMIIDIADRPEQAYLRHLVARQLHRHLSPALKRYYIDDADGITQLNGTNGANGANGNGNGNGDTPVTVGPSRFLP